MATHAAIGVHDDLATGEARVPIGSTDHETPGRIDVKLCLLVDHLGREGRLDDLFDDRFSQGTLLDVRRVLGRHDDGIEATRLVVLVLDRHLGLAIGAKPLDDVLLANVGESTRELVRKIDRHRHELTRLVDREPEHQSLVARTLFLAGARIHAAGDVG